MAKKATISFHKDNIIFEKENNSYKVVQFYPATMEVQIQEIQSKKISRWPFAHLPKNIKKQIKPN
jgi:hypothetical protein